MVDVVIRRYGPADEQAFFAMLEGEGDDWREYVGPAGRPAYARAMRSSIAYLLLVDGELCGYARCRDDDGFGVYVHDLLVRGPHRGRHLGRALMERVCADAPLPSTAPSPAGRARRARVAPSWTPWPTWRSSAVSSPHACVRSPSGHGP